MPDRCLYLLFLLCFFPLFFFCFVPYSFIPIDFSFPPTPSCSLLTATLTSTPLKPTIKRYKYQMRKARQWACFLTGGDIEKKKTTHKKKEMKMNLRNSTLTIGRILKCIIIDILAD